MYEFHLKAKQLPMPRLNNVNVAQIEKHTSHSQDIKKAYVYEIFSHDTHTDYRRRRSYSGK